MCFGLMAPPCYNQIKHLIGFEENVGVRHQLRPLLAKLHPVTDDATAAARAPLAQLRHVGVAGQHSVLGLTLSIFEEK